MDLPREVMIGVVVLAVLLWLLFVAVADDRYADARTARSTIVWLKPTPASTLHRPDTVIDTESVKRDPDPLEKDSVREEECVGAR